MNRIVIAAIWSVTLAATIFLGLLARELSRKAPAPQPLPIEQLPARQQHNTLMRWTVTEHLSAHRVMIAHVETDYLSEAVAISQQIADPIKSRYAEVLIYFHRPGRPDTLPPRRVQWTAATGYVESVFATGER